MRECSIIALNWKHLNARPHDGAVEGLRKTTYYDSKSNPRTDSDNNLPSCLPTRNCCGFSCFLLDISNARHCILPSQRAEQRSVVSYTGQRTIAMNLSRQHCNSGALTSLSLCFSFFFSGDDRACSQTPRRPFVYYSQMSPVRVCAMRAQTTTAQVQVQSLVRNEGVHAKKEMRILARAAARLASRDIYSGIGSDIMQLPVTSRLKELMAL